MICITVGLLYLYDPFCLLLSINTITKFAIAYRQPPVAADTLIHSLSPVGVDAIGGVGGAVTAGTRWAMLMSKMMICKLMMNQQSKKSARLNLLLSAFPSFFMFELPDSPVVTALVTSTCCCCCCQKMMMMMIQDEDTR